jgi:hypothetical protein
MAPAAPLVRNRRHRAVLDFSARRCIFDAMTPRTQLSSPAAVPPGGLTRLQVARQLGVSVTAIHRMRLRGDLRPKRDAAGVWRYDPAEVIRACAARHSARNLTLGQIAAQAFGLFDQGGELKDIVMALQVPPEEVRRLYREWQSSLDDPPPAAERGGSGLLDEDPGADEVFARAMARATDVANGGAGGPRTGRR